MIKRFIKFNCILTALVLCASAVFFCCACTKKLPRGVKINGVDVSRTTYAVAKEKLRESTVDNLSKKRLRICVGEQAYKFCYPEINFSDCFEDTIASIKKSGDYLSPVTYYLCGAEDIAEYICSNADKEAREPYCTFNLSGEPFTYYEGSDGAESDKQQLLDDITKSLNSDFYDVTLKTKVVKPKKSMEDVKNDTVLLYSFTTCFDGSNTPRSSNIRLAGSMINGVKINSGESFSFNGTVGARTEERGFKHAKIIENGRFVEGIGGGVCQVSTTLYNSAILSGLEIEEYHPHSLQVSYVDPSRDAMVSGNYYDLKFKNNTNTPIYIRVNCTFNSITCSIFGRSDGFKYEFRSQTLGSVPRPPAIEIEGEEEGVLTPGKDGLLSKGEVVKIKDGKEYSVASRNDKYLPVADTVTVKREIVPPLK